MADLSRFEDPDFLENRLLQKEEDSLFTPRPRSSEEDFGLPEPEEPEDEDEELLSPLLNTKEGISEQLITIIQDSNTSQQVRVSALKLLREHEGFSQEKPKINISRLSDVELEDCIRTIVIPACEPFGIREK